MENVIYMDNNATTRPRTEVVDAMQPYLQSEYANPSSVHQFGQRARQAVELAREKVAALIGAEPKEVVFTSGGTESIHLALHGLFAKAPEKRHLVTSKVEHAAVREVCGTLRREGFEVSEIGVDKDGQFDEDELVSSIREDTAVVTLVHANNETGVLFDVESAADICENRGVVLHIDAVQAAGKVPIDVRRIRIPALSLSAHKFHGPKGIGALYVRSGTPIAPMLRGGHQERGRRGGTENVAGIVGMGVAAAAAANEMESETKSIVRLRDMLEAGICKCMAGATVIGVGADRVCNTTNIAFAGTQSEALLILLSEHGICASAGAACSSGSLEPSHVLRAMNICPDLASGAVRFSLSQFNTTAEVETVIDLMPRLMNRISALNPS